MYEFMNLQLFDAVKSVTNTTFGDVNSYTGAKNETGALSTTMKTYYDTELLENTRENLIFAQLGKKQTLPANHGKIVEWRKWNTLGDVSKLTEGVIPEGKKLGQTSQTVEIAQYGDYVSISDQLELHALDDTILGATEELGAASAKTYDKLVRDTLLTGTNIINAEGALTPGDIAKAVTQLKKKNVKPHSGNRYVAVIHPSVAHDLRQNEEWIEYHKYAATTEIFNGEIGELHGVRFVESTLAPVGAEGENVFYSTFVFGKDAFAVVDPEGAGMETIIKDKSEIGGPLNQFSTVGCKFSMAAAILYPEAMVQIYSGSSYGEVDEPNQNVITIPQ